MFWVSEVNGHRYDVIFIYMASATLPYRYASVSVLAISREIRVFPRTVGNTGKYWEIWKVCSYLVI